MPWLYAALCGCSALCYTGGFEGRRTGGDVSFLDDVQEVLEGG